MWQWNSEPMMERPTKRSPTRSWPFAWSTAIRAEQPVPQGERSILPGRMTTALLAPRTPSRRSGGAASWQKDRWSQSGLVGWRKPSCSLAAWVIFKPVATSSAASSARRAKPRRRASAMTKLSPP